MSFPNSIRHIFQRIHNLLVHVIFIFNFLFPVFYFSFILILPFFPFDSFTKLECPCGDGMAATNCTSLSLFMLSKVTVFSDNKLLTSSIDSQPLIPELDLRLFFSFAISAAEPVSLSFANNSCNSL